MPPEPAPLITGAIWNPAPIPGNWNLTFTPPLTGSIGPTLGAPWALRRGLLWIPPAIVDVLPDGSVRLVFAGNYNGTENRVRYTGGPPFLMTAFGKVLQPFEHDIPF